MGEISREGILIAGFGTTDEEASIRTLKGIEDEIKASYPGQPISSGIVSKRVLRLLLDKGIQKNSIEDGLCQLKEQKVQRLSILPLFITTGKEYDSMCTSIKEASGRFETIRIGKPLLSEEEDWNFLAKGLIRELNPSKHTPYLFIGHGTYTGDNRVYKRMEEAFHNQGWNLVKIGMLKSFEYTEASLWKWRDKGFDRITLLPFLMTAGWHAANDMAGDQETSWKSRLEKMGFQVHWQEKGLGEYQCVKRLLAMHVKS